MKILRRMRACSFVGVMVVAAGLGYWLFGPPGVALWAPLAAGTLVVLHYLRRVAPELSAALPLLLAGAALGDSTTLGWGGADAPDGTRFKASPIGLSHVLAPRQRVSPTVDCRWHFASGDAGLRAMAPGAHAAYYQLLAVFPILCVAIAICLQGALAQCRSAWRRRFPLRVAACSAAGLTALALWLFSQSLGPALAVLAGLEVGTGGTLGTMEVTATILLCLAAGTAPPRHELAPNQAPVPIAAKRAISTPACPTMFRAGTVGPLPRFASL